MLRILLCYIFLLLHLPVMAGEVISVKDIKSLQPTISIYLNDADIALLDSEGMEGAGELLTLYMVVDNVPATIPVAGTYRMKKNELSFTPLYTLGHDTEFEIRYKNKNNTIATKRFHTLKHHMDGEKTHVTTMYPLADTIPYNTLFFHVRFDHTMMNDKRAYRHVKVYDDKGAERTNAWRQKSFWLDSGRLLVLMIHPGRVKNGIHYESPLFDSGRYYTINIGRDIQDMNGNAIKEEYTRRYYVKGEDRQSPKANINKAILPGHGTKQPVILSFSEGMDNASVLAGITVADAKRIPVPCTVREKGMDNTFSITPLQPWVKGTYTLLLKSAVYDFSANRINRRFEITDVSEIETDKNDTVLEFIVK